MDKFYLSPNPLARERGPEGNELNQSELGVRRIFNETECRFLSLEARSMAYGLFDSQSVSSNITENAVQQAVTLGSLSGEEIDVQTFEALFHAVSLNPSFKIPAWFISSPVPSGTWIC